MKRKIGREKKKQVKGREEGMKRVMKRKIGSEKKKTG